MVGRWHVCRGSQRPKYLIISMILIKHKHDDNNNQNICATTLDFVTHFISISIYLSVCLSIYLSVCLSVCLSIYLTIHLYIPSTIIYLYIIHLSSMYLADFADYQTINPPNGSQANLIESNLTKVIQSIYVKEYFKQNETSLSTQHSPPPPFPYFFLCQDAK